MNYRRCVSASVAVVVALCLLATPVAAQSVGRSAIDDLNTQLLYVALPLALFVELILVYALYRFRDNDDPEPTVDDPSLEVTWTAATAVILLFVGVSGYFGLANPYVSGTPDAAPVQNADVEIEVVAYQWGWQFHYPDANVTTQNRLVLPRDADVALWVETRDVIHSLYVPALGIKQDAIPGQRHVAVTNATSTGTYELYCAELCGAGHSRMHGTVVVANRSTYDTWLRDQSATVESNRSTAVESIRSTRSVTVRTGSNPGVVP